MPTNEQYQDHSWCIENLKKAQEAQHDLREQVREAHLFVDKRDGHWEPHWWTANDNKPRYSFDLCNPIIDQICGHMESMDFDIRITPSGGDATKDVAMVFDGVIRNIEAMSDAQTTYSLSAREMATGGLSGWRVKTDYINGDSFDQDLCIEPIGNFVDRVWHGPHEKPDASDAKYCWVLTGVPEVEFKNKYPDRTAKSVDSDSESRAYFYRQDCVMVGEFLYLKEETRTLTLMDSGTVYDEDELASVRDELELLGVKEVSSRKRKVLKLCSRLFDNDGWIEDEKPTVFENWVPVVPVYGNFKLSEDKIIYWGAVEKLMDAQRVFDYSLSREIEEGALAPRAKIRATQAQAEGHEEEWAKLNTSADPVLFYNVDPDGAPPPDEIPGGQINPGLRVISEAMQTVIGQSAGLFAANMGDNPGLQSGVAINALQDRGDTGNNKYITAMERAQRQTARILVNAIPKVYSPGRQVRVLKEDGSFEIQPIGMTVVDQQTGEEVVLNDLSVGVYDVSVSTAPSFKNRQSETVTAITELAKVDPTVVEIGKDILLGNIPSPGMDKLQERARQQLFMAGAIPESQLTDEEMQKLAQIQQQPPQESPEMVLARAEETKGQADLIEQQNKQIEIQADTQVKLKKVEIDAMNAETSRMKAEIDKAKAMAEIKGMAVQAAKTLSEAEAQEIENIATESRVIELAEKLGG